MPVVSLYVPSQHQTVRVLSVPEANVIRVRRMKLTRLPRRLCGGSAPGCWPSVCPSALLLLVLLVLSGPAWATGMDWFRATDSAPWHGREVFASLSYNGQMWVLGGMTGGGWTGNDVWHSPDGVTWTEATDSAGWCKREGHAAVVFDNKMWVLGGIGEDTAGRWQLCDDVWWSSDGVRWARATASAAWSARVGHSVLVLGGKMWLFGGADSFGFKGDVWSSIDGTDWTRECDSAGWYGRASNAAVMLGGRMSVMGGWDGQDHYFGDVWSSSDGKNWSLVTDSAPWGPRAGHSTAVHDSMMWVLAGANLTRRFNDVWCSTNGSDWTEATDSAQWAGRVFAQALSFDGKIWILGGATETSYPSDAWYSAGLGVDEEKPMSAMRARAVRLEPNPFRNRVALTCGVRRNSIVRAVIRDCSGTVVRELVSRAGKSGACRIDWDGRDRLGKSVPAGVYLVVISDGGVHVERKLVRLR